MFGSNLTRAESSQDANGSIRQTDSDAAIARLSAVKLGYLQDPFIRFLVQRPHLQPPRPPLINIGTYVRSEAIDKLVEEWLELSAVDGEKCQIVSMGAGSDTRYWRINVRGFFHRWPLLYSPCLSSRSDAENAPGRPALTRIILLFTSSSIFRRTLQRRRWRFGRVGSLANIWKASSSVSCTDCPLFV